MTIAVTIYIPVFKYIESAPTISVYYLRHDMTSEERHENRYRRRVAKRREREILRGTKYTNTIDIFGTLALDEAFKLSRKGTDWKASVQKYGRKRLVNARKSSNLLLDGNWRPKGFYNFTIFERGKLREIKSVHISERCVQSSLCNNALVPIIRPKLIYDNGASIKGKGTDFFIKRLVEHLRYHIRKHGIVGGIYLFDFSSYFANILNAPLKNEVRRLVIDDLVFSVYEKCIDAFGPVGLGLGSQVSQISAVFYPNSVDHLVKDRLRVHGYGRFMDDGYIICHDICRLKEIVDLFEKKCASLGIKLNKKKCHIVKFGDDFKILKTRFRITASGKIIRRIDRTTITRERHRLRSYRRFINDGIATFDDVKLWFHSWLCSKLRVRSFQVFYNMIAYFNLIFKEFGEYHPPKTKKRSHKVLDFVSRSTRRAA